MEYFRSLGTSLLQQSGVVLPFAIGERVTEFDQEGTIWTMYDAVKRDDQSLITVFSFETNSPYRNRPNRKEYLPIAKNALRKIRSTRHPDILKFIEAYETETLIYIATERVKPLVFLLSGPSIDEDVKMWGLHRISTALSFLNTQALSIHGLIRRSSIFVTESGEWRLGGLDLLSSTRPSELETGLLWTEGRVLDGRDDPRFATPEVIKSGWNVLKESDPSSHDAYTLALLIHSIFNPTHPFPPPTASPPHPQPLPSSRGSIPPSIFPQFKKMLNPNPKARLTTAGFLLEGGKGEDKKGYFGGNRFVWVGEGLDGWGLKGEGERAELLKAVQSTNPAFPPNFLTHKVLPSLLHSLSLPSSQTSASTLLPIVLKLGGLVPPQEYIKLVLDPVVKLYASPDRGTRMALLEGLPEYEGKMDQRCVVDKVWPHLITGFADTVPIIREATIQSLPLIAPKLSDRLLNNDLLRLLAKSQLDPEPSIRTNTCILLGRLAPLLGPNTKRKVLVPAFGRALKDGFVHARVAGLMAFMACGEIFEREDVARGVVPVISAALVDKEKIVRDQAFKAIDMFIKRLEKLVVSMPETVEPPSIPSSSTPVNGASPSTFTSSAAPTSQAQPNGQASTVSSTAGAAGALAGWAFGSLGKQLVPADLQSAMPSSSSATFPGAFDATPSSSASHPPAVPPSRPSAYHPSPSTTSAKPLALGGKSGFGSTNPRKQSTIDNILADEADPWGEIQASTTAAGGGGEGGDLMDVNDDADDWGMFEEAPVSLFPSSAAASAVAPTLADRGGGGGGGGGDDGDGWDMDEPTPPPPPPPIPASRPTPPPTSKAKPTPTPTPKPKPKPAPAAAASSSTPRLGSLPSASSAPSSPASTPLPGTPSVEKEAAAVSLAGLSKEDKEKEMARRREERKARIAGLKKGKGLS